MYSGNTNSLTTFTAKTANDSFIQLLVNAYFVPRLRPNPRNIITNRTQVPALRFILRLDLELHSQSGVKRLEKSELTWKSFCSVLFCILGFDLTYSYLYAHHFWYYSGVHRGLELGCVQGKFLIP